MKTKTEVVRGQPVEVEGHLLVPVARRTTAVWHSATIGDSVAAHGGGFVGLCPLGVVEQRDGEERFVPIPDRTRQALLGMLALALIVPLVLILVARLTRR